MRASLEQDGARNLETVELGLREAMAKDARRLIEALYCDPTLSIPGNAALTGENCPRQRPKKVETIFGPITLRRDYFAVKNRRRENGDPHEVVATPTTNAYTDTDVTNGVTY